MNENEAYSKIIGGLITTLNKFSLYPSNHPLIKNNLAQTHSVLKEFLDAKKELTFSLSPEEKIIVEGEPVANIPSGLMEEFVQEVKKLQAESITFSEGLTPQELEVFVKIMLTKTEDLQKEGGINQVLLKNGASHIRLNLFSYIKIDKDRDILNIGKEKGEHKVRPYVGDFGVAISKLLQGTAGNALEGDLRGRIYRHFVQAPQDVLAALADVIANVEQLDKVLDAIGESSISDAKTKDVKLKIDLAKSLAKFSSQAKKLAAQLKDKAQADKASAAVEAKVTKYTDRIFIDAVIAEFAQKKTWTSTISSIFKRFFPGRDEKNRISQEIKSSILETGLPQELRDNFFTAMEGELSKEEQVKDPKLGKKELEALQNENAQLRNRLMALEEELKKTEEIKRRHKKLVDEKERVENIIHHMAEGLVVVDSEGKTLLINPAAEKLLGVGKEEAMGRPLRQNIKDEHLLTVTKDLMPDSAGDLSKEIELFSFDESTKRILKTSSAVIENQDGKTVGMVTVLNDITRQKELEKLKSDFVANVSHELRTPLVVIQHSLSILAAEVLDKLNDDQKRFLGNAESHLSRLRVLINDLLDMSSIEAGKFKLKCGKHDINEMAKSVAELIGEWAKSKNIALELIPLPCATEVYVDKDRIIQVITNLVGNAIKFTPEGGKVSILLSERAQDERVPCPAIEVCVSDTGIGIEDKDLERVFGKFEQVSLAQPAEVSGTGLGLPIAREIVQMHKGRIWVESRVGKGSKFLFLIPKKSIEVGTEHCSVPTR